MLSGDKLFNAVVVGDCLDGAWLDCGWFDCVLVDDWLGVARIVVSWLAGVVVD